MRFTAVPLLVLTALFATACDGDSGTNSRRLTPEEVGGTYQLCSLGFAPDGGSPPAVNVRERTMEISPSDPPVLRISRLDLTFQLEYTRKGDVIKPRLEGSYSLGRDGILLNFGQQTAATNLLLPERLDLSFQESPKRLQVEGALYRVPRSAYERVAGQNYPNVTDQILGTLSGTLSTSGCG